MYEIQKLDKDLVWLTTHKFHTMNRALKKLEKMANRYGWKFVATSELFNGHYVDPDGNCYRVY